MTAGCLIDTGVALGTSVMWLSELEVLRGLYVCNEEGGPSLSFRCLHLEPGHL